MATFSGSGAKVIFASGMIVRMERTRSMADTLIPGQIVADGQDIFFGDMEESSS